MKHSHPNTHLNILITLTLALATTTSTAGEHQASTGRAVVTIQKPPATDTKARTYDVRKPTSVVNKKSTVEVNPWLMTMATNQPLAEPTATASQPVMSNPEDWVTTAGCVTYKRVVSGLQYGRIKPTWAELKSTTCNDTAGTNKLVARLNKDHIIEWRDLQWVVVKGVAK